jgi:hypothetical protein
VRRTFAAATLLLALPLGTVGVGCKRSFVLASEEVPAADVRAVAVVPEGREPSKGQTQVLGTGWYANLEIDADDQLHLAWTDADLGDVLYARMERGSLALPEPEVVEHEGAVGSYLRLALAPGGVPVLSYYHQDKRTLRLAHRPRDLEAMKAAGARLGAGEVKTRPTSVLVPGEKPPPAPDEGMGEGWHGEEVAFGDNAGLTGSLVVDKEGAPHLIYYTTNERLRYATRPAGVAAFGADVYGAFDKLDLDEHAGGSYTMSTDLRALDDGTIVASYAHWNYVDSQLKVGLRRKGAASFEVVEASPMHRLVDGWHSTVLPAGAGEVDVFSVATGEQRLLVGRMSLERPGALTSRQVLLERPGATVVRRAEDGTLWILSRGLGMLSLDEEPGVWLVRLEGGDPGMARRWLLEKGVGRDPWIDLELLSDGSPVAVWTSRETLSMKLYTRPAR